MYDVIDVFLSYKAKKHVFDSLIRKKFLNYNTSGEFYYVKHYEEEYLNIRSVRCRDVDENHLHIRIFYKKFTLKLHKVHPGDIIYLRSILKKISNILIADIQIICEDVLCEVLNIRRLREFDLLINILIDKIIFKGFYNKIF